MAQAAVTTTLMLVLLAWTGTVHTSEFDNQISNKTTRSPLTGFSALTGGFNGQVTSRHCTHVLSRRLGSHGTKI